MKNLYQLGTKLDIGDYDIVMIDQTLILYPHEHINYEKIKVEALSDNEVDDTYYILNVMYHFIMFDQFDTDYQTIFCEHLFETSDTLKTKEDVIAYVQSPENREADANSFIQYYFEK